MRKTALLMGLIGLIGTSPLLAKKNPFEWGGEKFLLTGYSFLGYRSPIGSDYTVAGLSPIFLIHPTKKVLLEIEPELALESELETSHGKTERELNFEVELEYAQVDWILNKYLTLVVGQYLTPFGVFMEKLHPAWINKLPTFPLPYSHDESLLPFNQVGLQARSGVRLGPKSKINYAAFVSNGAKIEQKAGHGASFTDNVSDNNSDKGFGGRVGLVPNKFVEFGASYFNGGTYDDNGNLKFGAFGVDAEYHWDVLELRGEWLRQTKDERASSGMIDEEETDGLYAQVAVGTSFIPVAYHVFNPLEVVARYGELKEHSGKTKQTTLGFSYQVGNASFVRLGYEITEEPASGGHGDKQKSWLFQVAHGF